MQRFARLALFGILGGAVAAVPLTPAPAPAQFPGQQPAAGPDGVEVLTRGPVHEAFASTAEQPTAGPVIQQLPPNPVEELPPDQRPEGDNVQWVSGYWHFDEEKTDFIWISGFWRVPPPGRVWLAGSWREVPGGRQWVHGFWQDVAPAQFQQPQQPQQLEYLPPPPQPLELAPSVPSPDLTSFYVPGSWMWRGHYVWRPGYWIGYRPDWVWVPAHYRATPGGYLFIDGYWDYPLERRGVLFAPVYFAPVVLNRPTFVYTPTFAVSHRGLVGALFVRRGWSSYYFGDYFEPRYSTLGFNAWCGSPRGTNFALTIGFNRGVSYDPLWNHYQIEHRADPVFVAQFTDVYAGRYRGDVARPPRTLIQQTTVVNNITNVTNTTVNNTTVNNTTVNNTINNKVLNNSVANLTMVQPLKTIPQANTNVVLKAVAREEQVKEQQLAKQTREVGVQRSRAETKLADRQLAPAQATDKPRQVKLDVPQQMVARAQAPEKPQYVLPPKPTAVQADLNAKAPAKIPPAAETGKPGSSLVTPAKPLPTMPVAPSPTNPTAKPLPTPAPVKPDPKVPVAPMPVKPEPQVPVTPAKPLPTPVNPVTPGPTTPVMPVKPVPTNPAPVNPKPPANPMPVNPAVPPKPLPNPTPVTPTRPEVKPAVPQPLPPKLGVPPAPVKPMVPPPASPPPPVVQAQKVQPAPAPMPSLPPPQVRIPQAPQPQSQPQPQPRPEVRMPQAPVQPQPRPEVKVPPVNVPPAKPAPKDPGDPKKPGQPMR